MFFRRTDYAHIVIIALARDVILIDFTMNVKDYFVWVSDLFHTYSFVLLLLFFLGGALHSTALGVFTYNRPAVIQCHSCFFVDYMRISQVHCNNLKEVF